MKISRFNQTHLLGVSLLFVLISSANAAENVKLSNNMSLLGDNAGLTQLNSLSNSYEFKAVKKVTLPNGEVRYKFKQYYNGIPVVDSLIVSNKNSLKSISPNSDIVSGSFISKIETDISTIRPALSKMQAFHIAKKEANIANVQDMKNSNISLQVKLFGDEAKLVFLLDFYTDNNGPSRPFYVIDAMTGAVLQTWEGLTSSSYQDASGPGGNKKTGMYNYGSDYGYLISNQVTGISGQCRLDSPNVVTYDMDHQKYGGKIHQFNCGENTYKEINGAYSPLNDAHYFGNVVYDMYKDWFDSAPLTFKLKMRVHYDQDFENAFWDGRQMTFGDGRYRFYPLVSLDVVGHEVSHGFTEQNSNLVYQSQSGGINEAFSDMAGEAAEYFMNLHKPESERVDWLVGGTIDKQGQALRYFKDPTKDGRSIGHANDYYEGLNVHYSSGVFNKAFYLLATTEGWNLKKAFEPFVLANQIYWGTNTNFEEGGCGVNKAATDLGYDVTAVVNAFKQVGVNATCGNAEPEDPTDPTDPTEPKDPTEPDPNDPYNAVKLENSKALTKIADTKGGEKLFYIDVNKDNAYYFNIYSYGSSVVPIMRVRYNDLPTKDVNDCTTEDQTRYRTCNIRPAKRGRYYIQIVAEETYDNLTLYASYF